MPTGKNGKGRKLRHKKTKPPGPLSDCKLPHDVILNILSRLPVKSLLKFKSVCKPWRSLIRNPKLISFHLSHHHSSATSPPLLLLQSFHKSTESNRVSIFSLQPFYPLSVVSLSQIPDMEVVGTHHGLVCISRPGGDIIIIFNPMTKQILRIKPPRKEPDPNIHELVSLGFGFDPVENRYKVIRIHSVKEGLKLQSEVYVYRCDLGSWKTIEIQGPKISFWSTSCALVLKGVPYWFANLEDDHGRRYVLVWFDVENEAFHHIPIPILSRKSTGWPVDWKGELAMITYPWVELEQLDEGNGELVHVFVIKDDSWWSEKCSVGPIKGMKNLLGCSRNGQILGTDGEQNLIMYDPETHGIKRFDVDGNRECNFVVFNYRESLVSFKGESQLITKVHTRSNKRMP